jgi:Family of unknown function (DUF5681)
LNRGGDTRFQKGHSGNPAGRPKARRPHVSAFDIIFDKTLTVTQNGIERELTVDEGLQLQTYQAALKGGRMAIRSVLKMIEKREAALALLNPPVVKPVRLEFEEDSNNINNPMLLLGIAEYGEAPYGGGPATRPFRLATWAAQFAISRPGRRALSDKNIEDVKRQTINPVKLRWPRGRRT